MATTVFDDDFDGTTGTINGHAPVVGAAWDTSATYLYPSSVIHIDGSGSAYNNHASATGSSLLNAVTALPSDATLTIRMGWLTSVASHNCCLAFYTDPADANPDYRLIFNGSTNAVSFVRGATGAGESNIGPSFTTGLVVANDIWFRATVTHSPRTFKFEYSTNGTSYSLIWTTGNFNASGVYTDASPPAEGPQQFGIWWDRRGATPATTGVVIRSLLVVDNAASVEPGSGTATMSMTGTAVGGGFATGSGTATMSMTGTGVGTTAGGESSGGTATMSMTGTAVGTTFGAPAPTLLNTLAYRAIPIRFDSGYTPTRFRLRTLTTQLGEEELGPWQTDYIVQVDSGLNTWKFGPVAADFEGEIIVEDASAVARTMSVSARPPSNAFGIGYVNSGAAISQLAFSVSGITLRPGEHLYEGRQLVFRSGPNVGMRREIRIHTYAAGVHRFEFTPAQRLPFLPEAGDWVEVV